MPWALQDLHSRCTALGTRDRNVLVVTPGAGGSKCRGGFKGLSRRSAKQDRPNLQRCKRRGTMLEGGKDTPDYSGRGLAAHSRTQNYLAGIIRDLSWMPRSPRTSEPQYDLAWIAHDMLFVCEVKSLTSDNEERQLRMATGQIIRYRQQLTAAGHEPCFAAICTERQPSDPSWDELCEAEGIILIWPEVATARLKIAVAQRLN